MAYLSEAEVTGNAVGTQTLVVQCLVAECVELAETRPVCLVVPAAAVGSSDGWRPTAVSARQVLHAAVIRQMRTVVFVPSAPAVLPPPGTVLSCAELKAHASVSEAPSGDVAVVWFYDARFSWRWAGRIRIVHARSEPAFAVCDGGPCPTFGTWEARVHGQCNGCITVPPQTHVRI